MSMCTCLRKGAGLVVLALSLFAFSGVQAQPKTAVPKVHKSTEADDGLGPWVVKKSIIPHLWSESMDLDRINPEWVPVKDINPVILEGIVTPKPGSLTPAPHVSFEDLPI